jgi:DNA repair protein RecO (recombination protein O)
MLQKSRAIILHAYRYGESSLIVHAYTEAWGRTAFLLKGVRKSRKNQRSSMFQPLYLLDLDVYYRENREMQWIRDASFSGVATVHEQDITKSTQAIFISEVLMKTIGEEERNPALFSFLEHTSAWLFSSGKASPSFHLFFLFKLSRYLGFYPRYNYSEANRFFNIASGSFSSLPDRLDAQQETLLGLQWKECFQCDYNSDFQAFNNHEKRNLFLDSLLAFYRLHHHSMRELKSLDVLRTVFS